MLRNGCIYEFTCAKQCGKKYIGETKRILKKRIAEHFQESRASAVCEHTKKCEHFQKSLSEKLSEKPNSKPAELTKIRMDHQEDHFRSLAFNTNYYKRTTIEALLISLDEPELNKQDDHKNIFLL